MRRTLLALGSVFALLASLNAPAQASNTEEALLEAGSARVHYATSGPAAPPSADAGGNGIPDYVELIAGAAENALTVFRGFGVDPLTIGGPAPVEIYVGQLEPGTFGETALSTLTNKPIVAITNALDLDRDQDLLLRTVAHELFHVVQYRYTAELPLWIAEGTATAMAARAFPGTRDPIAADYERLWRRHPSRALDDESRGCERCYGGSLWWQFLSERNAQLIPNLFTRLAADSEPVTDRGVSALGLALTESGDSLRRAYADFTLGLYRTPGTLGLAPALSIRPSQGRLLRLPRLASSYIPIRLPKSSPATLALSVSGSAIDVALVAARPNTTVYARFEVGRVRKVFLPRRLQRHGFVVVVSNGGGRASSVRIALVQR